MQDISLSAASMSDCYEWLPGHGLFAELSRALSKFTTQKANGSRVDYADDAVGIAASTAWEGDLGYMELGFGIENSEFRIQNSELRILGAGCRVQRTGDAKALWACHFSHSICLGVWALMVLYLCLPHATVFVYHLSAKRDLSIFLQPLPLAFPDSGFRWCLRNVSVPSLFAALS